MNSLSLLKVFFKKVRKIKTGAVMQKFLDKMLERVDKSRYDTSFKAGDTLKVYVKIIDGTTKRTQLFEGLCLARHNNGVNSTFLVRKLSNNEGVERIFPLYSDVVEKIEVVKRGRVRRAKIYYMRNLRGKAARIKEIRDTKN